MGGIPPVRHGLLILQISITAAYKSNFLSTTQNNSTSICIQILLCLNIYKQQSKRGRLPRGTPYHMPLHTSITGACTSSFPNPWFMMFNISGIVCTYCKSNVVYKLKDISLSVEELRQFLRCAAACVIHMLPIKKSNGFFVE